MKVLFITSVFLLSFIAMIGSCEEMGILFWISFSVFAMTSVYIERNQKVLEMDLDDFFNENHNS